MNLLNTLIFAADEEQLRLHPLPEHAAASQAEHVRRHYALLLAAVLTVQPAISEPQTRLLRLLLDSLKLGDIRGQLFEQARALEPTPLLEAARVIREAVFAQHLVLDTLVLLRLDAPLSDEAARLTGELAAFLDVDESALAARAADAAEILGLKARQASDGAHAEGKNGGGEDEADNFPVERFSLADYWPARLPQPLTEEALRQGLQGGLWVLDADLAMHFPWQANGAALFFRNGAALNTIADAGEIRLQDCHLLDAVLAFQGGCNVTLQRCNWQGDYEPAAKRTALNTNGSVVKISDSRFSTRNAQAIMVLENKLTLTESRFTQCGHAELAGGAVLHSDEERKIENCRFDRCIAARGGALYFNKLYGVNNCEFVACESRALAQFDAGDIAVYAEKNTSNPVLTHCVFRRTSLNVGNSYDGALRRIAVSCQFIQSNLYHYRDDSHTFATNCIFEGGRVIEKRFD